MYFLGEADGESSREDKRDNYLIVTTCFYQKPLLSCHLSHIIEEITCVDHKKSAYNQSLQ